MKTRKHTIYPQHFKKEMINYFMEGHLSREEIAARYDVPYSTIAHWIRKYSKKVSKQRNTDADLVKESLNRYNYYDALEKLFERQRKKLSKQLIITHVINYFTSAIVVLGFSVGVFLIIKAIFYGV